MNPKHRLLATVTLAFAVSSGLSAQTVIDQLYGLRNYDLADAYWAAGQKFADLGQADRGAEFKAKALRLFPGYVPGQAPVALPAAAVPAAPAPQIPAAEKVREANLQGQKIARLQFQKLLRGYLTGNGATVAAALAPTLTVQGQVAGADGSSVSSFLESHPAEAGAPDELFLLDTLEVADGTGTTVVLTVRANPEAPAVLTDQLAFWKPVQKYTFDRVGDTWKLASIEGN